MSFSLVVRSVKSKLLNYYYILRDSTLVDTYFPDHNIAYIPGPYQGFKLTIVDLKQSLLMIFLNLRYNKSTCG